MIAFRSRKRGSLHRLSSALTSSGWYFTDRERAGHSEPLPPLSLIVCIVRQSIRLQSNWNMLDITKLWREKQALIICKQTWRDKLREICHVFVSGHNTHLISRFRNNCKHVNLSSQKLEPTEMQYYQKKHRRELETWIEIKYNLRVANNLFELFYWIVFTRSVPWVCDDIL